MFYTRQEIWKNRDIVFITVKLFNGRVCIARGITLIIFSDRSKISNVRKLLIDSGITEIQLECRTSSLILFDLVRDYRDSVILLHIIFRLTRLGKSPKQSGITKILFTFIINTSSLISCEIEFGMTEIQLYDSIRVIKLRNAEISAGISVIRLNDNSNHCNCVWTSTYLGILVNCLDEIESL